MATQVMLHNPDGTTKIGYVGFSWTCLFFSWLVPLFRGDYITGLVLGILWFMGFSLIINVLMAFFYNRYHQNK